MSARLRRVAALATAGAIALAPPTGRSRAAPLPTVAFGHFENVDRAAWQNVRLKISYVGRSIGPRSLVLRAIAKPVNVPLFWHFEPGGDAMTSDRLGTLQVRVDAEVLRRAVRAIGEHPCAASGAHEPSGRLAITVIDSTGPIDFSVYHVVPARACFDSLARGLLDALRSSPEAHAQLRELYCHSSVAVHGGARRAGHEIVVALGPARLDAAADIHVARLFVTNRGSRPLDGPIDVAIHPGEVEVLDPTGWSSCAVDLSGLPYVRLRDGSLAAGETISRVVRFRGWVDSIRLERHGVYHGRGLR